MKKNILIVIILVLTATAAFLAFVPNRAPKQGEIKNSETIKSDSGAEIITAEANYYENFKGYLAKPAKTAVYPGIILIHEFWGLNDNIKTMARELAKEGYAVLAIDLFGEVTADAERAAHLVSLADQAGAIKNMRAAVNYLRENEKVSKVASLGWCFGGGQSLQLALSGEPMDATIIYYGRLTADKERLSQINWPILGIFAGEDRGITVESVKQFEAALAELNKTKEIYIYPGVNHAFANPSGANYAPRETKDAWEKTLIFLEKYLKNSARHADQNASPINSFKPNSGQEQAAAAANTNQAAANTGAAIDNPIPTASNTAAVTPSASAAQQISIIGTVLSVYDNKFVMTSGGKTVNVALNPDALMYIRKRGTQIAQSNIKPGHEIRIVTNDNLNASLITPLVIEDLSLPASKN